MSQILQFLRGGGTDHKNRTLDLILASDDVFLEEEHDYIQWLFPLKEPSANVLDAPVITDGEVLLAQSDKIIRKNMQKSLDRMILFYRNNNHWLKPKEHNHLRITRILKSTAMILSEEEAERFYDFIMDTVCNSVVEILPSHVTYWTDAVRLSFDESVRQIRGL